MTDSQAESTFGPEEYVWTAMSGESVLGASMFGGTLWAAHPPTGATVAWMLCHWPTDVRVVSAGETKFGEQYRAAMERQRMRDALGTAHVNFDDASSSCALVAAYFTGLDSDRVVGSEGMLSWSNEDRLIVHVAEHSPKDGAKVWALVEFHGVDTLPSLAYFEEWTPELVLPDYGRGLAGDFARSRFNRWLTLITDFGVADSQAAALRAALFQLHSPDRVFPAEERFAVQDRLDEIFGNPDLDGFAPTMPEPRLVKTAAAAEAYATEVMQALGFHDARPTPPGPDGGIDVTSGTALAQVKMEGVSTGAPLVQALYGIAALEGKMALFFSLAGYTPQALAFADRAGVACFEFAIDGSIAACNEIAANLYARGSKTE